LNLSYGIPAGAVRAVHLVQDQSVPSGQPVTLVEVLIDDVGGQTWLRFRFVAPQIARNTGTITFEAAAADMAHLCDQVAVPYIAEYDLTGDIVVISMSDRPVDFGAFDQDATQFFEAYRLEGDACVWEAL